MKIVLIVVMLCSCLGIGYILNKQLKERIVLLNALLDFSQRILKEPNIEKIDVIKRLKAYMHTKKHEIIKTAFESLISVLQEKGISKHVKDKMATNNVTRFLNSKPYNLFFDAFLSLLFTHDEISRKNELGSRLESLSRECQRSIDEINTSIKTNYLLAGAAGVVLIILIL